MDFLAQERVGDYGFGQISSDLLKSLQAGHGTDSANMTGGRALIPQDIDATLTVALAQNRQDFKLMNLIRSKPVHSTVHEYTRQNEVGDESLIFAKEAADARDSAQSLERVVRLMKYMQTYRQITLQMQVANTIEDAEAIEKEAGTLTILKGAEFGCFHGNSAVVPEQFDGVIKQIMDSPRKNVVDMRGKNLTQTGEEAITELARQMFENGGNASHAFYPPILGTDFQVLARDRFRIGPNDSAGGMVIESYPTPFSDSIAMSGHGAGPNKMFRVKGVISPNGDVNKRPGAPTFALAAQSTAAGKLGFVADTAGTYRYTVFAVDENGVSTGATAANQAVTAGQQVQITITPDATRGGTGFIICRGRKDVTTGDDLREMVRIPNSGEATTVYLDQDYDLPGTGEIVLVSHSAMQPSIQFTQFLPLMKFNLYPTRSAIIPFLIVMFGALDVKVPWFQGVIKNVGYQGVGGSGLTGWY